MTQSSLLRNSIAFFKIRPQWTQIEADVNGGYHDGIWTALTVTSLIVWAPLLPVTFKIKVNPYFFILFFSFLHHYMVRGDKENKENNKGAKFLNKIEESCEAN